MLSSRLEFPYYRCLDGLRGLAAILVLYYHSGPLSGLVTRLHLSNGGFIGVDIFFVLSAFLIGALLLKEYLNRGTILVRKFYARRFLRLFPPLLLAGLLFLPLIAVIDGPTALKEMVFTFTYTTNIAAFLRNFLPPTIQLDYFSHTWTLAAEEQFYIIFPLVFLGFLRRKLAVTDRVPLMAMSLFALFLTLPLFRPLLGQGVYFFPLWRFGEFLAGFVAALFYANIAWPEAIATKTPWLQFTPATLTTLRMALKSSTLTLVSLGLLAAFLVSAHRDDSLLFMFVGYFAVTIITSFLILQMTTSSNETIEAIFGHRVMVSAGVASYGLYLYHVPILKLVQWFFTHQLVLTKVLPGTPGMAKLGATAITEVVYLLLTGIVTYASYRWLEQPVLRYKNKVASGG
jgi:peptidoglycan/LPS O-acetylase OafA/YrhL